MARSALRNPEEVTSKAPTPSAISDTATVVLFDFDGTLGDTETPAMIVAFWELAPYFPEASVAYLSEECMRTYVRDNAGKAFEFMVDVVEEDRKKAGLPSIEEVRAAGAEDPLVLAHVNEQRAKSGLPTIETTRSLGKDILTLQKDETVEALATSPSRAPTSRASSPTSRRSGTTSASPPPRANPGYPSASSRVCTRRTSPREDSQRRVRL